MVNQFVFLFKKRFSCSDSFDPKLFPWSTLLSPENSQWSVGAKSGDCGGWGSSSRPNSWILGIVYNYWWQGKRSLFPSSFVAVSLRFPYSNAQITPCNIRYWCFFLFKVMDQCFTVAITFPAAVCVFSCFGLLKPVQTIQLTLCNSVFRFHLLIHTALNSALHRWV